MTYPGMFAQKNKKMQLESIGKSGLGCRVSGVACRAKRAAIIVFTLNRYPYSHTLKRPT